MQPVSIPGGCQAILLAGGRARRLGRASKPLLRVHGATLLDHAIAAANDLACAPIIAVGAELPSEAPVHWTREDPPFGGPAAGIVAGLSTGQSPGTTDAEWTLVLACDLPRARSAARLLADSATHLPSDSDGLCLGDTSSRPQWLTGLYRTAALHAAALRMSAAGTDAPVRDLMAELAITVITDPGDLSTDIDTWDDFHSVNQQSEEQQ